MNIATANLAPSLLKLLADHGIDYDIIHHHHADSSLDVAHAAHIPADEMIKSVILEDEKGYVMALVAANQHVKIRELNHFLDRKLGLATETEIGHLFSDCEIGAIPPIGEAYGMEVVVDYDLDDREDVYLEAGNHEDLLHLSGHSFRKLMKHLRHARISIH